MAKDAAYWREYRARKSGKVVQPQPQPQPTVAQPGQSSSDALSSLAPARGTTRPGNGGTILPEPRKKRVPLCAPAPRDAYERAKSLLAVGRSYADVKDATGQTHLSLNEAAMAYDDFEAWKDAQDRHKSAMAARIAAAAMAAGENGVKRKVVRKTDAAGLVEETVTEEHGTDAALLRVAGEYTDPERFGKLAAGKNSEKPTIQLAVVFTDARRADVRAEE